MAAAAWSLRVPALPGASSLGPNLVSRRVSQDALGSEVGDIAPCISRRLPRACRSACIVASPSTQRTFTQMQLSMYTVYMYQSMHLCVHTDIGVHACIGVCACMVCTRTRRYACACAYSRPTPLHGRRGVTERCGVALFSLPDAGLPLPSRSACRDLIY